MITAETTKIFMTAVIIVLLAYELLALSIGTSDSRVSDWFAWIGIKSPFAIFAFGWLACHFWGYVMVPPISAAIKMMRGE